MRPAVGELVHFSEDPDLDRFVPHVARTATDPTPYVWAVGADHAPSYWFPRACPRGTAWLTGRKTDADRQRVPGPGAHRVHLIEYAWWERMAAATIFGYRFVADDFEAYGDPAAPHAYVARHAVRPLGPAEPVGNLITLHERAGIELRLAVTLWPWWDAVIATTVGFSGIRLGSASPRRA